MNRILEAISFATYAHSGQKRKGKEIPYITHPLSVGILLAKSGASEEVVIAGILHDTIEDTEVSYEDIVEKFGKNVADMVNDVTEQDKSLMWIDRKKLALDHVKDMNPDSVLVKTADVLHNMTEQVEDYKIKGDEMFESFNAGKLEQLDRYNKLVAAIKKRELNNLLIIDLENTFLELQKLWG